MDPAQPPHYSASSFIHNAGAESQRRGAGVALGCGGAGEVWVCRLRGQGHTHPVQTVLFIVFLGGHFRNC